MVLLDVLIIGGGPHALTLATLLSNSDPVPNSDHGHDSAHSPSCSDPLGLQANPQTSDSKRCRGRKKRRATTGVALEEQLAQAATLERVVCPPLSFRVVDSYGEWTTLWESQFTALNIPHLRSHTLVHTDPLNKVERYSLDRALVKGTVEHITPVMEEENDWTQERETEGELRVTERSGDGLRKRVKYFQVQLQEGLVLKANQVVMATGPTRAQMANIPSWVKSIEESYPEERLQHTVHLMHRLTTARQQLQDCQRESETFSTQELCGVCEAGQRVMVVGGGLTSAHVVSIALQQGAGHVTWVMRKHLQLKQFDVGDVESLVGRYSHVEHGIKMDGQAYLRQFYNERSLHKRLAMIRQARKGGAVTPEAYIHLQPFILSGQVDVKTYCEVSEARWCYRSQAWSLSLSTGERWTGDMIWLATGCKLDVRQDPLLSAVMKEFPIQVMDGWPCISESLQWAEGCPLYLMGQYTALQIGPHAVNLAGGQAASMRIAKNIRRRQRQDDAECSELCPEKSTTEEYIQHMQGLLWL
ncbi:uncharacterized protein LOC115579990 isoform X2 [Sparus aurata]|uniref:uncharacterized protein LOC115579990 isoform X2 n=1 Tax=Sparus aurata TaxID=8175 RepID=UPI0011C0F873|nr:uncharacterized protein LOC115579990 isoform X2 [Sparus aurata]